MIKFLCASCGERLSVPDQNAGRKGVCPSCRAINRIPLKDGTVPQKAPVAAAAVEQQSAPESRPKPAPTAAPRQTTSPRSAPIATTGSVLQPARPEATQLTQPDLEPFKNLAALLNSTAPPEAPPPADDPADHVEIYVERRLPRKVKITLLILAALAFVGAIYFALYSALHAFLKASGA